MDTHEYWRAVRAKEAELKEEFVLLVSLEKPRLHQKGGVIVEATRYRAAQCLTDETHRVATKAEIEAYRAEQAAAIEAAAAREKAKELFVAALPTVAQAAVADPSKPAKDK